MEGSSSRSKSERIQELVQQMKAGTISKSELFVQLSALQRGSRSGSDKQKLQQQDEVEEQNADEQAYSAHADETRIPPPEQYNGIISTPERRAMIIQRLFEEKRLQRQNTSVQDNNFAEGSRVSTQSVLLAEQEMSLSKQERQRIADVRQRQQDILLAEHAKRNGFSNLTHNTSTAGITSTTSSGHTLSARARRFQDDLVKKQQTECTFSPEIHDLPEEYGVARSQEQGSGFQERVNRWKARKLEEIERKRIAKEEAELQSCTFTPKISRRKSTGGGSRPGTPQPQQSRRQQTDRPMTPDGRSTRRRGFSNEGAQSVGSRNNMSAHLRLYENSKVDRRAELQRQALLAEEARLKEECTFHPDIGKQSFAVHSRYRAASPRTAASRPSSAGPGGVRQNIRCHSKYQSDDASSTAFSERRTRAWDENLTFSPQTNPVHPSMQAAQVYLRKDVVTRLTRPRRDMPQSQTLSNKQCKGDDSENIAERGNQERTFDNKEDRVIDVSTFLSSSVHDGGYFQTRQNPDALRNPHSAEASKPTPEQVATRRKSFEQFLVRQQQQEVRKQRKIAQVAKQIENPHSPALCKKSVEIFNQRQTAPSGGGGSGGGGGGDARGGTCGSFLDRVARSALKKEHDTVRRKSQYDPECTFAPKINDSSRRKPARSALEMSRGDSLKRETKARLVKLRHEQEESQDLTFTPQLETASSLVARKTEGRLKILSEPETYIRRLQHKNSLHSHKANKQIQEQEMKELEECTFRPQIHEAPTYVKRIVRSLALAKPAREAAEAKTQRNAKPDWK